jgi:hypothetical protein
MANRKKNLPTVEESEIHEGMVQKLLKTLTEIFSLEELNCNFIGKEVSKILKIERTHQAQ